MPADTVDHSEAVNISTRLNIIKLVSLHSNKLLQNNLQLLSLGIKLWATEIGTDQIQQCTLSRSFLLHCFPLLRQYQGERALLLQLNVTVLLSQPHASIQRLLSSNILITTTHGEIPIMELLSCQVATRGFQLQVL